MSSVNIFISHSTVDKEIATSIKMISKTCGFDAFVAHEDIRFSEPWKEEIRKNLLRCDAMVVLVSEDSKKSFWVNQEIGFAMSRDIPLLSIQMGADPFGFLADYQGLKLKRSVESRGTVWDYHDCIKNIVYALLRKNSSSKIVKQALIDHVKTCENFYAAAFLFEVLSDIPDTAKFTDEELQEVIINSIFNNQVTNSFGARPVLRRFIDMGRDYIDPSIIEMIEDQLT